MNARAVITGRGAVSPAGIGVQPLWDGVRSGVSFVRGETSLDLESLPIAAVSARLPTSALDQVNARWRSTRRSDAEALLWDVIDQALAESQVDSGPPARTAFLTTQLFESGFEDSTPPPAYGDEVRSATGDLRAHYLRRPPVPREGVGSSLITDLAKRLGGEVSVLSLQATCATGLRLVCDAARLIQLGRVDRVVIGVVSRPVDAVHFAAFARALALSRWQGIPSAASRPFDQQRSGFVLGEAAAGLVLESETLARRRGVPGFARVLGWGLAMSSHHFLRPSLTHLIRVMRQALAASGVAPGQIDLLSAMGSSTGLGDSEEARAIHRVFGEDLDRLRITAEKATLGYSVQAAALLEIIASTCVMKSGLVPPVPHCERQDTDLELPISASSESGRIDLVLKNAFGLGGHYGSMVMQGVG